MKTIEGAGISLELVLVTSRTFSVNTISKVQIIIYYWCTWVLALIFSREIQIQIQTDTQKTSKNFPAVPADAIPTSANIQCTWMHKRRFLFDEQPSLLRQTLPAQ